MKILFVDDVKLSLEMGKMALLDSGCHIMTAMNGVEALEIMTRDQPDLVLSDLYMPGMNGDELCRNIKEDSLLSSIPVIIISSVDDKESQEKCRASGCDDILRKPYSKGALIDIVKKYINIVGRKHRRFPVNCNVLYNCDGKIFSAAVNDISEGGMFIKGNELLPLDSEVEFTITSDDGAFSFEASGRVVRVINSTMEFSFDKIPGMGVQFSANFPQVDNLIRKASTAA